MRSSIDYLMLVIVKILYKKEGCTKSTSFSNL